MTQAKVQVEEITINVPWGHIAAKWWGPKTVRPIVAVHGWQDNAGTFDRLLPLLPTDISYLAIDLPGHGLSSWIPDGSYYSPMHYVYVLLLIMKHFKWNQMSLMGHSFGGILCFLYASIFPQYCDFFVGFDFFLPLRFTSDFFTKACNGYLHKILLADERNRNNSVFSYTYDEVIATMSEGGYKQLGVDYIPYLLKRGIKPCKIESNKFNFSRDSKIKATMQLPYSLDHWISAAKRIRAPYCLFRALRKDNSLIKEDEEICIDIMKSRNKRFELHQVTGNHFFHLNDAPSIHNIVTEFINKYHHMRHVVSNL